MILILIYLLIALAFGIMVYKTGDGSALDSVMLGICWPISLAFMFFIAFTIFGIDD